MKKIPIILISAIAISFFLFRTLANRSTPARVPHQSVTVDHSKPERVALKTSNSLTSVLTSTKPVYHDKYFDKVAKITNTDIRNEPQAFQRIINNPLFCKMFATKGEVAGFYGKDHYKISYYIRSAQVDPSNKNRILIEGFSKYKKNIRNIKGYFEVECVKVNFDDESDPFYNTNFMIAGVFNFDETKHEQPVGKYEGKWVMDLSEVNNPYKELEFAYTKGVSDGNNLVLNGVWKQAGTDETKQVCFSESIEKLGSDIFNAFNYGDREISIRPEFAAKGWTEYYENNEWWSGLN